MAQEKRNPLPVGRYYVNIPAKHVADFSEFLRIVGRGIFIREKKETVDPFAPVWDPLKGAAIAYLFEVRNPLIPWDNTKFGWPTIANHVTSLSEMDQVPDYEPPWTLPSGGLGDVTTLALVALALWALSR